MATNKKLKAAKDSKNDEFYTRFEDIQNEINAYIEYNPDTFRGKTVLLPCDDPEWSNFTKFFAQNFENFGLKKLISTSFAHSSKSFEGPYLPSLFEEQSEQYDEELSINRGKLFILDHDSNNSGNIDINDLEWTYLEGNGDFKSEEVKKLRDEADIIVTNPPFSLFREFLAWIMEGNKNFIIIGHQNAITYRDVFALIKANKVWPGKGFKGGAGHFINKYYEDYAVAGDHREGMIRVSGVMWFTNLDHGRRHQPVTLMSINDNIRFSKHKEVKGIGYMKYENFDAIEVPFGDAIPNDFPGLMGVPVTFLNKYCPEQFSIVGLGISNSGLEIGVQPYKPEHKIYRKTVQKKGAVDGDLYMMIDGIVTVPYARIVLRYTDEWIATHPENFER